MRVRSPLRPSSVLCLASRASGGCERRRGRCLREAAHALPRHPRRHDRFCPRRRHLVGPGRGGAATRLTIHDGEERYPKVSPDGKLIAFTGEYDGNADVYVMSAHGGRYTSDIAPRSSTRWSAGTRRGTRSSSVRPATLQPLHRLFLVAPDGSGLEEWSCTRRPGSFSPDGSKIAYRQVAGEDRTWKRYRGGRPRTSMFSTSPRRGPEDHRFRRGGSAAHVDRRQGLLRLRPRTGPQPLGVRHAQREIEQLTRHTEYDVRRPSRAATDRLRAGRHAVAARHRDPRGPQIPVRSAPTRRKRGHT